MNRRPPSALTAPHRLGARFLAMWLLIAAIVVHAFLPLGSPLQRGSGSAFSASTSDVATRPRRQSDRLGAEASCRTDHEDVAAGAGDGQCDPFVATASASASAEPAAAAPFRDTPDLVPGAGAPTYRARAPPSRLHLA